MRLLIDTHVLIWAAGGQGLAASAEAAYRDVENELVWSAVSYWEIAIKKSIGKLDIDFDDLDAQLLRHRIEWLPLSRTHCRVLASLPKHHRDPFDRILAAQALSEGLSLISRDSAFDDYGVTRVW